MALLELLAAAAVAWVVAAGRGRHAAGFGLGGVVQPEQAQVLHREQGLVDQLSVVGGGVAVSGNKPDTCGG